MDRESISEQTSRAGKARLYRAIYAATVLKNCKIDKKGELKTTDASFEIYENAKCGIAFDTEIDVHANNGLVYLISIPDAVDSDFLNSFLSTFIFSSQARQSLPNISPTPAFNRFAKMSQPITDFHSPWNIYENEKFGFSISYPGNWKKKEMLPGEYRFDMIRIVRLQGAEGDFEAFLYNENDTLLADKVECIREPTNFGRSQNWRSTQLYDQKMTVCETNNGLRWKWIFHKPLPAGKLRIIGGTSMLRHPNSNDKDIILQILSTLKLTR